MMCLFRKAIRSRTMAFLLMLMSLPLCLSGQVQSAPDKTILLGAAWYPEQWPESRWGADLDLMQAAHMHVVRVGEFAWSALEPTEGKFDFGWLDRAIQAAAAHQIAVVLGTPTAAPPAWLTSKYPDTLRVDEDGRREEHGNRQQFSFTSPRYRQFSRRIAEQMAIHYGHNPNVIGWQIDNELAAPSFDESAKAEFHRWLKARYGTIASLNQRWTTAYWSQTYDNFEQIPVHSKNENPALLLDWKRFVTDTWVSYLANQSSTLRSHSDARLWITTNTMHFNSGFDHYKAHQDLDIAAWDDYMETGHLKPALNGLLHDVVRGYKNKNFWLMETQPGFVNWAAVNRSLDRGVVREMAWQAIAHGADAILYWQWRSALNGQEQYHGSLVGADGTPLPIYSEIKQLGEELDRAGPAIAGTAPYATVALINDYDSRWAIDFQRHSKDFDYPQLMQEWYTALQRLTPAIDVVSANATLTQYKFVFAPALNVISVSTAQHLREYVLQGGTLILGPRSGMKNEDNALYQQLQPGPLADLLGGHVEQFYALDSSVPIAGAKTAGTATIWADQLTRTDDKTDILLTYGKSNGWLDSQPAAIVSHPGKGTSNGAFYYFGAWMDPHLTQSAFSEILRSSTKPLFASITNDMEVTERAVFDPSTRKVNRRLIFFINHGEQAEIVKLPASMTDLVTAKRMDRLEVPPHGVAVLEDPKPNEQY